jgi:hypothetical protein
VANGLTDSAGLDMAISNESVGGNWRRT